MKIESKIKKEKSLKKRSAIQERMTLLFLLINLMELCPQYPNTPDSDLHNLMELRGIEPLSESLFIAVSPITVIILTFPLSAV